MSLIAILLLAWIFGYTVAAVVAWWEFDIPDKYTVQGPILLLHTERGKPTIKRIASACPRFWRVWGIAGVVFAGLGLLFGAGMLVLSAYLILREPSSATIASDPKNILVIPGVNDFLPLEATPAIVIAMLVGLVTHELGHAIYCRRGDIKIESTGLALFALIPAGAFVEPDEESTEEAPRWAQLQMISAGVMNNLLVTLVAFALLIVLATTVIAPASGAAVGGVLSGSPADDAGLGGGDLVTQVNGESVESNEEMQDALDGTGETVTVTTEDGEQHSIDRSVIISAVPQSASLDVGTTITHVDDTAVSTESEFDAAIREADGRTVELRTAERETVTYPVGARVTVAPDSPLAGLADEEGRVVVTHFAGESVHSAEALESLLDEREAGESVSIQFTSTTGEATPVEGTATLDDGEGIEGKLGVVPTDGVAGLGVTDFGVRYYPAEDYLSFLGTPSLGAFVTIFFLPFGAFIGLLPFNFAGFTSDIASFYTVSGVLSPVEGGVLFTASVLFWTVWLNANLALFNCIPAVALDGGHYIRLVVGETVERLGLPNQKQTSKWIARTIVFLFLGCMLLVALLPAISQMVSI